MPSNHQKLFQGYQRCQTQFVLRSATVGPCASSTWILHSKWVKFRTTRIWENNSNSTADWTWMRSSWRTQFTTLPERPTGLRQKSTAATDRPSSPSLTGIFLQFCIRHDSLFIFSGAQGIMMTKKQGQLYARKRMSPGTVVLKSTAQNPTPTPKKRSFAEMEQLKELSKKLFTGLLFFLSMHFFLQIVSFRPLILHARSIRSLQRFLPAHLLIWRGQASF